MHILLVGIVQQFELSKSSMMQKLWTGLVPEAMRSVADREKKGFGQNKHEAEWMTCIHSLF